MAQIRGAVSPISSTFPKRLPSPVAEPVEPVRWIVNPWFDCLFLANLAWPLLLFARIDDGFAGLAEWQFWQVYFVTTPHRWITLPIVFLDRKRLCEQPVAYLGIAALVTIVCLGMLLTTGALTCLLMVDYVWNTWHFAAQHHGIYRLYGRIGNPRQSAALTTEKGLMRGFLLYIALRVAGGTWSNQPLDEWLRLVDWIIPAIPLWLLLREIRPLRPILTGRFIYLLSVSSLYLALLFAVHTQRPAVILSLTTASALFHAIEYLALVSWSTHRRNDESAGTLGALSWIVPRWGLVMCLYIVILGSTGWLIEQEYLQVWLLLNVIVAFLHYAYDGLIWRRPRRMANEIRG